MKRVYFDYAASTPVAPEAVKAMQPYFSDVFANPGSVHFAGRQSQQAVDRARGIVAAAFGAKPAGVIFTASATEANNLALRGAAKAYTGAPPHVIVSAIEHESVLDTARDMERLGQAAVTYVGVDTRGFVNPDEVEENLRPETVMVSIMQVNNVTGTIQPVFEIGNRIRAFRQQKLSLHNQTRYAVPDLQYPILHTDAAQAVNGPETIDLAHMGADMITISSHKICGPKGAAALIMANAAGPEPQIISPIITGGGQEFGLHSGTENVPAIVGFARALEITCTARAKEQRRLRELKKQFVRDVMRAYPAAHVNSFEPCVPEIVNVAFPGFSHDELLYRFDKASIAVSIGSACHAKLVKPSHVLQAMGADARICESALRFSFGTYTTADEMRYVAGVMKKMLA